MIDQIDQRLQDWVGSIVTGADVLLSMPHGEVDRPTICLHLLEIANAVPSRREQPRPLELSLRYLITTRAATSLQAHQLLGQLLFAALENEDFQVELKPLPVEIWTAFGLAPQPAFVLKLQLAKERPYPVKRVLKAVEVRVSPLTTLAGVVLGPEDTPIPHARVELPSLKAVTYTDIDGRFRFGAVPAEPRTKQLRIVARGLEQLVSERPNEKEPLVIRFQPKEN